MTQQTLDLDDRAVQRMLQGVSLAAFNPDQAWAESAQYMRVRTSSMSAHLRRGGSWRGVTWKDWAPQYVRKDGTVVPAWGGVPKVRGRGLVKGRKRPSGTRVTQQSALMQDTMTMRSRAALVVRRNRFMMQLGPQGVRYAARQNALRPFLFFEIPQDAKEIGEIFARHIATGAKTGRLPTLAAGLTVGPTGPGA
jgi:hypothetical protein